MDELSTFGIIGYLYIKLTIWKEYSLLFIFVMG